MTTDRDYADMVNPFARAEEEAEARGLRTGRLQGIWIALMILPAAVAFFYSVETRAAEYRFLLVPIRASSVGAKATFCQQYPELDHRWICSSIK